MSFWLQNVGNFLEKLDDQAERVAEDRIAATEGSQHGVSVPEDVQLQSILTARGLSQNENDDDEEEDEVEIKVLEVEEGGDGGAGHGQETTDSNDANDVVEQETAQENVAEPDAAKDNGDTLDVEDTSGAPSSTNAGETPENVKDSADSPSNEQESRASVSSAASTTGLDEDTKNEKGAEGPAEPPETGSSPSPQSNEVQTPIKTPAPVQTQLQQQQPSQQQLPPSGALSQPVPATLSPNSHAAFRETQKEARTLRRHVVSLNKQLEHAETELQAQRVELERAAERLEKDRVRHKEDREKEKNRHAEEVKTLKAQNEKAMKELKQRSDKQVEEIRKQLRDVEERRMQEGGDWNKELIDAVQREQDMAQKFAMIEDEKATLLSQITILQDQQEALGNRIESLTQTADNAMDRERESETRLDEALNLHARQIAQRQARESELERTVAELGSALVAARNHASGSGSNGGKLLDEDRSASSFDVANTTPEARVQSLEQDIEGMTAQLRFEQQRCETLQTELRDVSKERTDEATANHSRQIKYDRQVAELSHTIARLESELRGGPGGNTNNASSSALSADAQSDAKQLRELSEEVLRQREKIANSNSEISALKSRLKVANDRIHAAETALEAAETQSADGDYDLEQAPASTGGGMMRRRGGGGVIKRSGRRPKEVSMRAALHLDSMQGKSSEQIGKALDGVDAFLVTSGKFLRHNALARLLFIAYLLLLHIWTFLLIIMHAHGFETVHGDFGAGHGVAHGPHALMQEQAQEVASNHAAAAGAEAAIHPPAVAAAGAP